LRSLRPLGPSDIPGGAPRLVLVAALVLAMRGPDDEGAERRPVPEATSS
jgi:hypothetical protein